MRINLMYPIFEIVQLHKVNLMEETNKKGNFFSQQMETENNNKKQRNDLDNSICMIYIRMHLKLCKVKYQVSEFKLLWKIPLTQH